MGILHAVLGRVDGRDGVLVTGALDVWYRNGCKPGVLIRRGVVATIVWCGVAGGGWRW
uniref:Uncharacterized protein n=1 Tax=Ciona intestinalis TaxID=7719 RepID=H2Y0K2_CIOIN